MAVGLAALIAAAFALVNGTRPTGVLAVDAVVLPLLLGAVLYVGRLAPRPVLIAVAAVNLFALPIVSAAIIGVPTLAFAVWQFGTSVPSEREDPIRVISLSATFAGLSFAGDRLPFSVTTAIAILVALVVLITGWPHIPTERRAICRRVALGAAGFAVLATALFGVVALSAQDELIAGRDAANAALDAAIDGEVDTASERVAEAHDRFESANSALHRPWTWPAILVPGLAQHRNAAANLSESGAQATGQMEAALTKIDLDRLQIRDGQIDVEAVKALRQPVTGLVTTVEDLTTQLDDVKSGWLVPPVQQPIDGLATDLERFSRSAETIRQALDVLPAMLGADDPRTYFVMFTTPGEARGQGGFMSSYTTIKLTDGKITVGDVGRTTDLNIGGERPREISGPQEFLDSYGRFGFNNASGKYVGSTPWSNITISPDFPTNALVTSELFPQSGGTEIDGVISLDVYALAAIVDVTGPIHIAGYEEQLTGDNLVDFLLIDQYRTSHAERLDGLELIAGAVVTNLLGGGVDAFELGNALIPMARQQRLLVWSTDQTEAEMLGNAEIDGALFGGVDVKKQPAFAVRAINGSGSKIDTFLDRHMCIRVDGDGHPVSLAMTFTNTAPNKGLPEYIIGNEIGLPVGTSRLIVSFHSTEQVTGLERDGAPLGFAELTESGAHAYRFHFDLAAGQSTTVTAALTNGDRVAPIAIDPQPLVKDETWAVTSESSAGCESGQAVIKPRTLDVG